MNNFGFRKLVVSLKQNVRRHGVAIKLTYLTFKQDMTCQSVKVELQRFQIYNQFVHDVIYQWEANTLSKNGVRKVNKIQNGFNF